MILRIFLLFLVFFSPFSVSALSISTDTQTPDSGIFSVLEKVNKDKTTLSEKESHIKYEQDNIKENQSKIQEMEDLETQLGELENSLETMKKFYTGATDILENQDYQDKVKIFETTLGELLKITSFPEESEPLSFTGYRDKKYEFTKKFSEKRKEINADILESQSTIEKSQEELKILYEELRKSEVTFQTEVQDLALKIGIFIAALIFLTFFGKFLKNTIKNSPNISEEKKDIFLLVIRWVKNIIIIIIIFAFFFSEFVSILPFLAILGTALGFALRDIISSFIAWFVIGFKDATYKLGDVIDIESDKISGRIVKISPLVTVIQELGMSGPNGIYLSFPNKRIFETPIKNYSKMNSWIYISLDFFLDSTSDILLAKEKLQQAMQEVMNLEKFRSPANQKNFFRKFGYNESVLVPQTFLDAKPQGVMLRGKLLVTWGERHEIRTLVVEKFILSVSKNKKIKLLTIWQDKN